LQLYILNQKYLDIAAAESKASAFGWGWWEHKELPIDGTLLLNTRKRPAHLGLVRRVIKVLASCAQGNVRTTLADLQWERIIGKRSFKVVLTNLTPARIPEREFASVIWHRLQSPRVNLDKPEIVIQIVLTTTVAHVGIVLWENTEDFESRRAHLRPEIHPSSMHPALARAIVNLSCSPSVHDPFCGSGGLLIEAGLAHKRASGADINVAMIARTRANCRAYHLHPTLRVADATHWVPRSGAVIADLPYGRNTAPVALGTLLDAFLIRATQSTRRAVLGLPHEMTVSQFGSWRVRAHLTVYIHKSMTKHLYVLER